MDSARYERLHALFGELISLSPQARERRLEQETANDAELAADVAQLLANHDDPVQALRIENDAPSPFGLPPAPMAVPTAIGAYEVLSEIGRGGMGIVYCARQSAPDRTVAVKVLRPGLITNTNERRFAQEVQVLGLLDHPGIAKVFDAGSCDLGFGAQPFFVMELVDGVDLRIACEQAAIADRCLLVAQVADAIQHAHEKGIVHRDIKPENVLVTAALDGHGIGQPKLLDFGIARTDTRPNDGLGTITGHGSLLGTLTYMSPEQLSAGIVSPASDVFTLGVVLYELLAGRLPLDLRDLTLSEAIRIVQSREPINLSKVNAALSDDLDVVARTAMAKEPSLRYPSARAFATDLRRAVSGKPIHARRRTAWYRFQRFATRNRALTASLLGLAAVLLIGSIVTLILAANVNVAAGRAELRGYAGKTLAASTQLQADPYATEALLAATAEHLRGYEVRVMQAALDPAERLFSIAPELSRTCAFTRNARALVAFVDAGTLTIADHATGERVHKWPVPADSRALFFAPDGMRIGVACGALPAAPRRLIVYETSTATVLFDRADAPVPVRDFAFSPDNRYLLTRLRTTTEGLLRVDLHDQTWAMVMGPGANDVATILSDSRTFSFHTGVHDLVTGERLSRSPFKGIVHSAPNGSLVAGSHPDHRHVYLMDLDDPAAAIKLTSHHGPISSMQWNDTGQYLMSASQVSGSIRVTEPTSQKVVRDLHIEWIGDEPPRLHPQGDAVLVNTSRGIERLPVRTSGRVLGPHEDYVMAVAWSPDGALVASCDTKGRFSIWDVDAAERLFVTEPLGEHRRAHVEPASVAFSADGLSLYSVATWMRPLRMDLATGAAKFLARDRLKPQHANSIFLELAPGSRLARAWAVSNDRRWLTGGIEVSDEFHWASAPSDLFQRSPNGWIEQNTQQTWRKLANQNEHRTGTASQIARSLRDDRRQHDLCIAFDRHSEHMAIGYPGGVVLVWNLAANKLARSIQAHIGPAMALAWTPDGRLLSAGIDGVLTVWDPVSGNRLAVFEGHRNAIECIAVSPDGTRFATASEDRTVHLWDTKPLWQRREASERARVLEQILKERVAQEVAAGDRSQALRAIWTDHDLTLEHRKAARNLILRR